MKLGSNAGGGEEGETVLVVVVRKGGGRGRGIIYHWVSYTGREEGIYKTSSGSGNC